MAEIFQRKILVFRLLLYHKFFFGTFIKHSASEIGNG